MELQNEQGKRMLKNAELQLELGSSGSHIEAEGDSAGFEGLEEARPEYEYRHHHTVHSSEPENQGKPSDTEGERAGSVWSSDGMSVAGAGLQDVEIALFYSKSIEDDSQRANFLSRFLAELRAAEDEGAASLHSSMGSLSGAPGSPFAQAVRSQESSREESLRPAELSRPPSLNVQQRSVQQGQQGAKQEAFFREMCDYLDKEAGMGPLLILTIRELSAAVSSLPPEVVRGRTYAFLASLCAPAGGMANLPTNTATLAPMTPGASTTPASKVAAYAHSFTPAPTPAAIDSRHGLKRVPSYERNFLDQQAWDRVSSVDTPSNAASRRSSVGSMPATRTKGFPAGGRGPVKAAVQALAAAHKSIAGKRSKRGTFLHLFQVLILLFGARATPC
jgi:hypothetical protein